MDTVGRRYFAAQRAAFSTITAIPPRYRRNLFSAGVTFRSLIPFFLFHRLLYDITGQEVILCLKTYMSASIWTLEKNQIRIQNTIYSDKEKSNSNYARLVNLILISNLIL